MKELTKEAFHRIGEERCSPPGEFAVGHTEMNETEITKTLRAPILNDFPVPVGLLRRPQHFETIPYEMRIIKTLAFRVFGSSETNSIGGRTSYASCCTYQLSSRLVTHYVHYYEENRFQVRYRIGFTDTYVNIPKSVVSTLASGNQDSQSLYEQLITSYSPSWRPIQFHLRPDSEPSHASFAASMDAIAGRVPVESLSYFEEVLRMKDILVTVAAPRKTKRGDYRRFASGKYHITVNENHSELGFMLTLLHELAHAFAPRTEKSTPHDKYWKLMFANLIVDSIGFFPPELMSYLTLLACNPPSREDICEEYMMRNCFTEGFKEQSFSRIDLLRTKMKLEKYFGVKLEPFDS